MRGGCTPSVVKEGNTNEYKYPNLVHTRVECLHFFGCLYLAGKLDLRLQGKELKGRMTGLPGFLFFFFFALSCPTLCNPMDCSPPGSSVQGKNTGVGCHFLLQGGLTYKITKVVDWFNISL